MYEMSSFDRSFIDAVEHYASSRFEHSLEVARVAQNSICQASGDSRLLSQEALLFVYDLRSEPITFDFVIRLAQAEIYRRLQGIKSLNVSIILRKSRMDYGVGWEASNGRDSMIMRVHEIIGGCIQLFPAVNNISFTNHRDVMLQVIAHEHVYPDREQILTTLSQGSGLPPCPFTLNLTPTEYLFPLIQVNSQYLRIIEEYLQRFSKPVVSITIREYSYLSQERNSKIADWLVFADMISSVFDVIFIPDASQYFSGLDTYEHKHTIFRDVCWNIQLRTALYKKTIANLSTDGGPSSLSALQEDAKTLIFFDYSRYPQHYIEHIVNQYYGGNSPDKNNHLYSNFKNVKSCFGNITPEYIAEEFIEFISRYLTT